MLEKIKDLLYKLYMVIFPFAFLYFFYQILNPSQIFKKFFDILGNLWFWVVLFIPFCLVGIYTIVTANFKMYNQYIGVEKDSEHTLPLKHNLKNYIIGFIIVNGMFIIAILSVIYYEP